MVGDGIQCPLLASEKTLKRVEYNSIGGGGSYKGGAVPPTDLRGIAQKNAGSRKCLHGGTISTLSCFMYVQYKSVYMLTVDHMMTPR